MSALENETLSVPEYLALDRDSEERLELQRGRVFPVGPASRAHSLIATNLVVRLSNSLRGTPLEVYPPSMRVMTADSRNFYYPNGIVVRDPQFADSEDDTLINPLILIEVLPKRDGTVNWVSKLRDYRALPSVQQILLIDELRPAIDVYERLSATSWCISEVIGLEAVLPLPCIGCAVPLAEIYEQVTFPKPIENSANQQPEVTQAEIQKALSQLVGLKVSAVRRVADLRVLHFGALRAATSKLPTRPDGPAGTVGEFALHLQCAWRIETDDKIITGRTDIAEPAECGDDFSYSNWDYERDGNLQDRLIDEFIADRETLTVEAVNAQQHGSFSLHFNDGSRLVVFPSGSTGEDWRLFRPESDEAHFVVSGGVFERVEA